MTTILYDASQFSIVILMMITMFFLFMGHGIPGERGGWFLIFGGFFTISLMLALITMFSGLWWFVSPGCILFGVLVLRDGIMKAFYEKQGKG